MSEQEKIRLAVMRGSKKITRQLQCSSKLRCGAYIVGALVTLRSIPIIVEDMLGWPAAASRIALTPCIFVLSRAFVALCEEDVARWNRVPLKRGVSEGVLGMVVGISAFLGEVGVAYACGWVSFPAWGWASTSKAQVASSLLVLAAHHANVAWFEEMIFRGYGLDVAIAAFRQPTAVVGLSVLFALAHGPGWLQLAGQTALSLAATSMRLSRDSLWLPVAYHFAHNYVQTAVLGPPDARPSMLPMHLQGPRLWLGRPGYPDPGLLTAIAHMTVAVIFAIGWWRRVRRNANEHNGP